ncbi:MAG: helix-turn-helix transcriptional regulator [Euryarchaeota archaeon]|nr:helix-turn-helix transcriptional regulator [Euryarchaeota archaeon]
MPPVKAATPPKQVPKAAPGGCKIGELFRLLGESHVLDILYLFLAEPRPRRFVHIQDELKMSPNTLSDRLRELVKAGLLTRTAFNEIPPRVEYAATSKATEFQAVFEQLTDWAKRNDLQPVITPAP